jgi:hypothetical protein
MNAADVCGERASVFYSCDVLLLPTYQSPNGDVFNMNKTLFVLLSLLGKYIFLQFYTFVVSWYRNLHDISFFLVLLMLCLLYYDLFSYQ